MSIREIVNEKKEWMEQYDLHPRDYWNKRWSYLCRRLEMYSDMKKTLAQDRWYSKLKEKRESF